MGITAGTQLSRICRWRRPRRAGHGGPTGQLPISRVTACVSGERPTACSPFGEMGRSMTLRWAFFLLFFASTAFSQTPPPGSSSNVNPGRPVEPGRALYLR